ncbi:DUF397 domain-containing protein [Actinomadura barringtoniae]|uniref:DUF397 domain-containing protein n=1 Tax=Actinomadura barringtoniae TaxID=1427535 RepID=A0A939PQN3_9ACTN|nr:DUF397 domain-containing protein [Actinomadura barringtoniae]MBO2454458.1 DUF397 domain-containing protein [Actinomadura barringtoniae]
MTRWNVSKASWRKSSYSGDHGGACIEVAPAWRTSSHSGEHGGACVEVARPWRKSSRSAEQGGTCVEVTEGLPGVAVRDSKDPDGPILRISPQGWSGLLAAIKAH